MLKKILDNFIKYPDDECYQINDKIYRNKELYKYVCNIYNYIIKKNKHKKAVIVYGHKQIYMIASFLACSYAGFPYVPIDESTPIERKNKIISKIEPEIIIDENIESIMINENFIQISDVIMQDDDVYYILFTSGSTGEPKGVQITYKNLKSCMKWVESICKVNQKTILNQANFSFDLSVPDIYLSLLTRGKHYILEGKVQHDYNLLFEELEKSKANMAVFTPSFLDLLLLDKSFNKSLMSNLETILLCGEKLNKQTVEKLFDRFPGINLINSYGPTECTFAVTSIKIDNSLDISIGIPKSDVELYIVDENLNEVDDGEVGEILIVGESVGKGYFKLENNSFIKYKNKKGYLTGDLGYLKNGKYYCLGRKDNQIKYKGYRIELGEIESIINKIDNIERTIVTYKKDENNKIKMIIAFIVLKENSNITELEIKEILKRYLLKYMIPKIRIINEIPLTINGKADTKKLIEKYL